MKKPKGPPKRGRPAMPPGEARTETLTLKVSTLDLEALERAAKRAGQPLRGWMRAALLRAAK